MIPRLHLITAFMLVYSGGSAYASQLLVDITGDRLNYTSAVAAGSAQTTASWSNVLVPPVYAWQPGQLDQGLGSQSITLTGNTGETVNLTVNIVGLAYGGIPTGFTEHSAPTGLDSNTVVGKLEANAMVLDSGTAGTFASKIFQSTTTQSHTPFTLVRPVFSFTTADLVRALDGLKSADFHGSLTLPYKYRVQYLTDGIWSYEVRTVNFQVAVTFLAATLEYILVSGSGQLSTTYTPGTTEVRGEASYTVRAKGVMPRGIRMRFLQPAREFALLPQQSSPQKTTHTIPYSLKCTSANATCQISKRRTVELVTNGHFVGDSTGVVLITPTDEQGRDFQFNLDASFTSGFVPAGTYQDNFVVMFDVVRD